MENEITTLETGDRVRFTTSRGSVSGTVTLIQEDAAADGGFMVTIAPDDGSKAYRRAINFGLEAIR